MQHETTNLKPLEEDVLEKLKEFPQGIKRRELQIYLFAGFSSNADRRIRHAIKGLRDKGFVIVSSSDHSGYKLTTDQNEVKHYVAEQIKRAKACMRTARRVRQAYQMRDQLPIGLTS
jgi:hypothetical protein